MEYPLLTKQDILDAYKISGLKPKCGIYISIDNCGCPIGAIGRSIKAGCTWQECIEIVNEKYGVDNSYAIIEGFDGYITDKNKDNLYCIAAREASQELFKKE